MNQENFLPNIHESAKVYNLEVTINNVDILVDTISDIQIDFGRENKGKIVILDTLGLPELIPLSFSVIRIHFFDPLKVEYKNEFIVTKVDITRHKSGANKLVIYFKNFFQYSLEKLYVSKAYSNKKMSEMLLDIFDEYEIPVTFMVKDEYTYENFVFPKNISMWDFLNKYLKYVGYDFYFDLIGMKIASRVLLEGKNLPLFSEDPYVFDNKAEQSFFNIVEFNGIFSNTQEMSKVVSYNRNNFNDELKYEFNYFGIEDVSNEEINQGFVGLQDKKIKDFYPSLGIKEIDTFNYYEIIGENEDYRNIARNNQNINIVIQGTNIEKLYQLIKLNLPKGKNIKSSSNEEISSGYYIITQVRYKIISGMFVQALTLQSYDYPRGDRGVK